MAQAPLTRFAAVVAVAAFGASAERIAGAPLWTSALDLVVGVAAAIGAAGLPRAERRTALVLLAFSLLWFCGTLGGPFVLAYRGPLLQLLWKVRRSRSVLGVAVLAWACALLPFDAASPATCVLAVIVAAGLFTAVRGATAGDRQAVGVAGLITSLLALQWLLALVGAGSPSLQLATGDVLVLASLAVVAAAAIGLWAREAERALVVELGPSGRPGLPLTTRLSRALADPRLEVLYDVPGIGWVNERGGPIGTPDAARRRTTAPAPGGGEVVLLHGPEAPDDAVLARAAASAAALALESARLDAEVRSRTHEVAESRLRLLGAVDAERRALEERLSDGVLARLRRVDRLLGEPQRRELWIALDELVALGRGLYPPALARSDLEGALREIAKRSEVPMSVAVSGDVRQLTESHRAAIWFVASEASTNIARHAAAACASLRLTVTGVRSELEVEDDGVGGAKLDRGLRGLADRVEALGGAFSVSSPPGGPTKLTAVLFS